MSYNINDNNTYSVNQSDNNTSSINSSDSNTSVISIDQEIKNAISPSSVLIGKLSQTDIDNLKKLFLTKGDVSIQITEVMKNMNIQNVSIESFNW